jgi:hypothetical protein
MSHPLFWDCSHTHGLTHSKLQGEGNHEPKHMSIVRHSNILLHFWEDIQAYKVPSKYIRNFLQVLYKNTNIAMGILI